MDYRAQRSKTLEIVNKAWGSKALKTYEPPKFNARDNLANLLFDGKASDMLNGRIEEESSRTQKKYKNSALKAYAGTEHSKRHRIKLESLKRSNFGSLTSKRDKLGNLNLIQKDNFGIKSPSKNSIDIQDSGANTARSKTSKLTKGSKGKLAVIKEEGGAVETTDKNKGVVMALDHFNGRSKKKIHFFP